MFGYRIFTNNKKDIPRRSSNLIRNNTFAVKGWRNEWDGNRRVSTNTDMDFYNNVVKEKGGWRWGRGGGPALPGIEEDVVGSQ